MADLSMIKLIQKSLSRFFTLIFVSFFVCTPLFAQEQTPASPTGQFGGVITATNNGVSIIPLPWVDRPCCLI